MSTRSVITVGPSDSMVRILNSMTCSPAVSPSIMARMASCPTMGSTGMLWYTPSSVKVATTVSRSASAQAWQKSFTSCS